MWQRLRYTVCNLYCILIAEDHRVFKFISGFVQGASFTGSFLNRFCEASQTLQSKENIRLELNRKLRVYM